MLGGLIYKRSTMFFSRLIFCGNKLNVQFNGVNQWNIHLCKVVEYKYSRKKWLTRFIPACVDIPVCNRQSAFVFNRTPEMIIWATQKTLGRFPWNVSASMCSGRLGVSRECFALFPVRQNPERTFYWFFEATCPVARDKGEWADVVFLWFPVFQPMWSTMETCVACSETVYMHIVICQQQRSW